MHAAPFEYRAPDTVDEVAELLHTPGAVVLAGGLSLVPALRRRAQRPWLVVDINRTTGLANRPVLAGADTTVVVGALCRQAELLRWARRTGAQPLLAEALAHVGTSQTREIGTVTGIVANGDAVTQLAAVCAVAGATVRLRGVAGERSVPAASVFAQGGVAGLGSGELVLELRLPAWSPGDGHAFLQTGPRAIGPATGGVAARVRLDEAGVCVRADVAPFVLGHDGSALPAVADRLVGGALTDHDIADAADLAANAVTPRGDLFASADYRRHLVGVLVRRSLVLARNRCAKGAGT